MIDSWLLAHALPPGITTSLHNVNENEEDQDQDELIPKQQITPRNNSSKSSSSKNSSGSGTPVRKISAHEFERGGLTKPLVTTVDGAPTFLSPQLVNADNNGNNHLIRKRSRNDIQGLNETDLILELVKDICNDLDIKSLCHKILQNVGILTNADR